MCLSGPIVRLIREVNPENGIQTKIATDVRNMHRNEEIYNDVNTFNPFRLNPSTGQPMRLAVRT